MGSRIADIVHMGGLSQWNRVLVCVVVYVYRNHTGIPTPIASFGESVLVVLKKGALDESRI